MYSKTNSRFKKLRSLYLLTTLFLLGCNQAFSYSLSSSDLITETDFFSTYKTSKEDKFFHALISDCYYNKKKDCVQRILETEEKKNFKAYKTLIKSMLVKNIYDQPKAYEFLKIFRKELTDSDLKKLIRGKNSKKWIYENFKILNDQLEDLSFENPNLLCSLKEKPNFIEKQLKKISKSPERFKMNFSSHPCGIDSFVYLKDYKKEKDKLNSGKNLSEFKYQKLQKKAALRYYKAIKKKAPKEFWDFVFKANKYTQELVLRNIFFRREYKKIAYLKKTDFSRVFPEAMLYVAKAFLYKGEHEKLEKLVTQIDFEKSLWAEEILMSLSASRIRRNKFSEAKVSLEMLLKFHENLRLSGLYWLYVINKTLGLEIENRVIIKQIEESYSFTYYGLKIMSQEKGVDYLSKFLNDDEVKVKKLSLSDGEIKKFLLYYSGGFEKLFTLHLKSMKEKMKIKELALFSILLKRQGMQLDAIKLLEHVWEVDESFRQQPFYSVSYPFVFKKEYEAAVKKLKYVGVAEAMAISRQESAFNPKAQSGSGAKGLMQVISSTGKEVARSLRLRTYKSSKSLFNPAINTKIGSKYLDKLIHSSKGYLPYALASYNAGPGNLYRWSSHRPGVQDLRKGFNHETYTPIEELWIEEMPWSETRFYVKAVLRNLGLYRLLLDQRGGFNCEFYWMCNKNGEKL